MTGFKKDATGYYILKDPEAILDYKLDWANSDSPWLAGDTILGAVWTVPTGITKTNESLTATSSTVWLSGGTAGTTYTIECKVTTAAGRIDERSFRVVCKER